MAEPLAVYVIDRRGRGRSGPQGPDYSIEHELEDLYAVQAQTEAKAIFGHSHGGLVALEAARCSTVFADVVVHEPGASVASSSPLGWMRCYRESLAAGDRRGAFARVVLLGGGKSRSRFTTSLFDQLMASTPSSTTEPVEGLDHTAPDEKSPELVAERVRYHLRPGD